MPEQLPKLPGRPPAFDPDPPILGGGDPLFARAVRGLMGSNPELKQKVKNIQLGPNEAVGDLFAASRKQFLGDDIPEDIYANSFPQIHDYPRSNILGLFSLKDKSISVNPKMSMDEPFSSDPNERGSMLQTLVHELGHAKGESEVGADAAEWFLGPSHGAAVAALKANKPMRYRLQTLGEK